MEDSPPRGGGGVAFGREPEEAQGVLSSDGESAAGEGRVDQRADFVDVWGGRTSKDSSWSSTARAPALPRQGDRSRGEAQVEALLTGGMSMGACQITMRRQGIKPSWSRGSPIPSGVVRVMSSRRRAMLYPTMRPSEGARAVARAAAAIGWAVVAWFLSRRRGGGRYDCRPGDRLPDEPARRPGRAGLHAGRARRHAALARRFQGPCRAPLLLGELVTALHEGVALDGRKGLPGAEGPEVCRARHRHPGRSRQGRGLGEGQGHHAARAARPNGAVAAAYRVTATPSAVLIGRDGRMLARATGTRPWDSRRWAGLARRRSGGALRRCGRARLAKWPLRPSTCAAP